MRKVGAPIIGLFDAGGARIQEGVEALGGYADIFLRRTCSPRASSRRSASSWAPARAATSTRPAMTDFIFMVKDTSYMYVTGPDVVKTVTQRGSFPHEDLGGATTCNAAKSGVADLSLSRTTSRHSLMMRRLIGFLPLSNREKARRAFRRSTIRPRS